MYSRCPLVVTFSLSQNRNNYGTFPDLVVFVALLFLTFDKTSQNVTIKGHRLYNTHVF